MRNYYNTRELINNNNYLEEFLEDFYPQSNLHFINEQRRQENKDYIDIGDLDDFLLKNNLVGLPLEQILTLYFMENGI
jgi:hypothetical protein